MVVAADHPRQGARRANFIEWTSGGLLDQTHGFGELIRNADPSTPVPTCPDWTLKQLFHHVGRGNRWSAQIISDRRTWRSTREGHDGKPPDDPDAAIDWLNDGHPSSKRWDWVGPQTRVWTFLVPGRPAGGSGGACTR